MGKGCYRESGEGGDTRSAIGVGRHISVVSTWMMPNHIDDWTVVHFFLRWG